MGQISFRWLGVGGIEIKNDQETLLIDPFLTRPKVQNIFFGKVKPDTKVIKRRLPSADYIFITHAHFDHLMDSAEIVRQTEARVFGSDNTGKILKLEKISPNKFEKIKPKEKLNLGKFQVEVLAGFHVFIPGFTPGEIRAGLKSPFNLRDYRMDNCLGFLVETSGKKFLQWSSSKLDQAPKADVIFLVPEENPDYYHKLLARVRPKFIVPIHWDDFFRSIDKPVLPSLRFPKFTVWPPVGRQNMKLFSEMINHVYPKGKVLIPEIFKDYEI